MKTLKVTSTTKTIKKKVPTTKKQEVMINNDTSNIKIIDVWEHNLEEEMEYIRHLIDKYPYIAMVGYKLYCNCDINQNLRIQSFQV